MSFISCDFELLMQHILLIITTIIPTFLSVNFDFSIVRITGHTSHFVTTSVMCRICYMTLREELKENRTAICGQHLELLGIFTVKK